MLFRWELVVVSRRLWSGSVWFVAGIHQFSMVARGTQSVNRQFRSTWSKVLIGLNIFFFEREGDVEALA